MYKIGNYNVDYITTAFISEGWTDLLMCDAINLKGASGTSLVSVRERTAHKTGTKVRYDFAFIPNMAFLANPDPLLKNCELKLSFDRSDPSVAVLKTDDSASVTDINIEDCFAVTEYISSEDLREYFERIDNEPILYKYEDMEVLVKTCPYNQTDIRFDNLRGGNTPTHMFAGLVKTAALNGDTSLCSTKFCHYDVEEMNFTLNGSPVNGYPLTLKNGSPIFPMQKFIDATSRTCNITSSKFFNANEFKFNWIYAHHFEAELSAQGWLGVNFKLSEPFDESDGSMSIVIWLICSSALKIDKFHQVEKLNL